MATSPLSSSAADKNGDEGGGDLKSPGVVVGGRRSYNTIDGGAGGTTEETTPPRSSSIKRSSVRSSSAASIGQQRTGGNLRHNSDPPKPNSVTMAQRASSTPHGDISRSERGHGDRLGLRGLFTKARSSTWPRNTLVDNTSTPGNARAGGGQTPHSYHVPSSVVAAESSVLAVGETMPPRAQMRLIKKFIKSERSLTRSKRNLFDTSHQDGSMNLSLRSNNRRGMMVSPPPQHVAFQQQQEQHQSGQAGGGFTEESSLLMSPDGVVGRHSGSTCMEMEQVAEELTFDKEGSGSGGVDGSGSPGGDGGGGGGGDGGSHGDDSASARWKEEEEEVDDNQSMEKPIRHEHTHTENFSYLREMIFGKLLNIFLLFLPLAYISHHYHWNAQYIFWFNFCAMVPLAAILGDFTELLAAHTNQVIGGLINATFGNAVEVVVAIQALLQNEIRVVQASMIGSIFSNLLLVLGCCFFCGGIYYKEQAFNSTSATANMSLLALSSLALVLPTPFADYYDIDDDRVLAISRAAALFLMFMYLQLLLFQLRTHKYLIADDDEDIPEVSFMFGLIGLVVTTSLIALLSDWLVSSIDEFTKESGISRTFVGLIILPIVGNAVEHITAVSVAMKDKMDLAMGVAVGSASQISLFVVPLIVLVGWATDKDMTLNFPHFEIILYILSVVIVNICLSNGKGNWLLGSLLCTTYAMVAVGFWYEEVVDFRRR